MKLRILTILGLSTLLFACGGNDSESDYDEDFDDEIEETDSLDSHAGHGHAPGAHQEAPAISYDTIQATGNAVDDISFTHGIAFCQSLMRNRINFVDPIELAEGFLAVSEGKKTLVDFKLANEQLKNLAQLTNNFQNLTPEQKAASTEAFVSYFYENEINPPAFKEISAAKFLEGVKGFIIDRKMPSQEMIDDYSSTLNEYNKKRMEEAKKKNEKEGIDFLAKTAKKSGVKSTPSGLLYEVIKEGEGEKPNASNTVTVHYEGKTLDGQIFDSSYQRGESISFGLGQVIKGWTEGLQLMSPGSKYKLYIPQELAYGERGSGQKIPPYSALIFTVELISFK